VPNRANGTSLVLTMPLWTLGYDTLTVSGGTWGDTALVFISYREFRPFSGVWLRGCLRLHRRTEGTNFAVPTRQSHAGADVSVKALCTPCLPVVLCVQNWWNSRF
jgi:hypothetical protein